MKISRLQITNFRNFQSLDIDLSNQVVIVGPNRIGKSNLIHALRLVLDPSLSDQARMMGFDDFWDGLPTPLPADTEIRIDIDLADFAQADDHYAVLADYLISHDPLVARLTYSFRPKANLGHEPAREADYEYVLFGANNPDRRLHIGEIRRLPLDLMPALRDAEASLSNWRRSPLRPLLDEAAQSIDPQVLAELAEEVDRVTAQIAGIDEISAVADRLTSLLQRMVGGPAAEQIVLGVAPSRPEQLIRSIRLLIDNGRRGVADASVGASNLLLLALQQLDFELMRQQNIRDHTFLVIEEPEAHLHPHVQRSVYKHFLRRREHIEGRDQGGENGQEHDNGENGEDHPAESITKIMTTHSPHVVSIAPLKSIVLLKHSENGSTIGASTASVPLSAADIDDMERYLDVTRAEAVFARGLILVEGEAEAYLIPAFSRLLDIDLDELGITVSPVHGTHFAAHLKFFGARGLAIPTAILTDLDPHEGGARGVGRVQALLRNVLERPAAEVEGLDEAGLRRYAEGYGIFLNSHTLEIDVISAGQHSAVAVALEELTENEAAKARARRLAEDPEALTPQELLQDIAAIGKGRFAQRLASRLERDADRIPTYITSAIQYLRGLV